MRIRTIKPEWLDDERLVLASPEARVLSVALILLADDCGNGRANRTILAARVFPGSRDPRETLAKALDSLETAGFVDLYEVDGQAYFAIRNWTKHQKVDHPGKPQVPGKPSVSESSRESRESLAKVPESLALDQDQEGTRKGPGVDAREARTAAPPERVTPGNPPPSSSAPVERMLRSLSPDSDLESQVVALVSDTRQAAGGAPYRASSHHDRDAVSRLAEWAASPDTGLRRLRVALEAFWAAKGTGARLSWMTDEDPGRWLGKPKGRRSHVAPAGTREEHEAAVAAAGGVGSAIIEI